jgi:hypothetical protein
MPVVQIDIVRYIDDWQPGFVECRLTDRWGRVWSFVEKVPVVTAEYLDAGSDYPCPGLIGCRVLDRAEDVVRIGIDPLSGSFDCEVLASAVFDDPA